MVYFVQKCKDIFSILLTPLSTGPGSAKLFFKDFWKKYFQFSNGKIRPGLARIKGAGARSLPPPRLTMFHQHVKPFPSSLVLPLLPPF